MEIPNTTRRHEVEVMTRAANSSSLHPPATRRPGRANRTEPISWTDRKKLAIECIKNEWRAQKIKADGDRQQDRSERAHATGKKNELQTDVKADGDRDPNAGK